MLANVGKIFVHKRGVADSGALLRRHHRLVILLGLTMPAPAMPTARELHAKRFKFLSDDEIDAALEELEKATHIFNGRVSAKVIDAKLKLARADADHDARARDAATRSRTPWLTTNLNE